MTECQNGAGKSTRHHVVSTARWEGGIDAVFAAGERSNRSFVYLTLVE
ncbi:MAG: hypothetical protein ACK562_16650 [Acidobacteriota bacterium]|jgi:hypothetical protein